MAAVEALNNAPRFQFVPTPWCDTAVTFARLGKWDMAMRIATGLVDHNAFDGCCAHRDLAKVAATNGDIELVKRLLSQAEAAAPRIPIPPQRTDLLASVAGEYARRTARRGGAGCGFVRCTRRGGHVDRGGAAGVRQIGGSICSDRRLASRSGDNGRDWYTSCSKPATSRGQRLSQKRSATRPRAPINSSRWPGVCSQTGEKRRLAI